MAPSRCIAFYVEGVALKFKAQSLSTGEGHIVLKRVASLDSKNHRVENLTYNNHVFEEKWLGLLNSFMQNMNACSFLSTHFFVRCVTLIAFLETY